MPYDNQDLGYEDVISPEVRVTARSIFLPIILAILKRPWLSIGSVFLVMIPIIFYLYSQVPRYSSVSIVSFGTDNLPVLISPIGNNALQQWSGDELYFYLLDSYDYRADIEKRVLEEYPYLPADSIKTVVQRDITYIRKRTTSSFININAESESPEFSKFLAEAAVASFGDLAIKLRRSDAKLVADFIDSQLTKLNDNLSQREAEIQLFLTNRRLVLNENDIIGGVSNDLINLENQLTEAKTRRDLAKLQIETYSQQIENRLNHYMNGKQDTHAEQIRTLRSRLDDLNDRLSKLINGSLVTTVDSLTFNNLQVERKTVLSELIRLMYNPTNASSELPVTSQISLEKLEGQIQNWSINFEQAEVQVIYYQAAVNRYLEEHPNLSQDILEYFNLSRARSVLQRAIDILIEKHETIRIEMAAESGGVKVIDEPHAPGKPIPQNRGKKLAAAFIIALVIGFGLAYVVDIFDNTVQGEIDIATKFNLPVYGSIPVLNLRGLRTKRHKQMLLPTEGNGQIDTTLLSFHSESSPVSEAYRSIRTSVLFTARERQQKAFVISSAVAGEGKSLTTYNLGVSFAQGGLKTLIVDSDLRRSSLHKMIDIDRSPGITDYLFGNSSVNDILVADPNIENLFVIPAGVKANNPADLLASHKMRQFIDEVSPLFEIILFDTPPVTPCMDSRNLANLVGGMIYIVRAELTKLNVLEHSLALINRINVEVHGVIVNYASFRYGYGYYYLYHRYHSYGYYSGGYHYYYYSYYHDSDTSEETDVIRKRKRRKTEPKEQEPTKTDLV